MTKLWGKILKAATVRLWALILAAPIITFFAACLVFIVWHGPWPAELAKVQLRILGYTLIITQGLLGVVVIALASVRVRFKGPGAKGLSIEVDHDDVSDVPEKKEGR